MKKVAGLILFVALGVLAAATAAALANGIVGYPAGEPFYDSLFYICHQYPTRSFWIAGNPLAICARCFGGYIGVSIACVAVLNSTKEIHTGMIQFALFLAIVGVGDALLRVYADIDRPNLVRSITGLMGGFGLAILLCVTFRIGQEKWLEKLSLLRRSSA